MKSIAISVLLLLSGCTSTILLLTSCAHKVELRSLDGATSGTGEANRFDKTVTMNIGGVEYTGNYVFSGWSHAGKVVAYGKDGSLLTCDFIYEDFIGLGNCDGKDGKKYSVKVHY